MAAIGNSPTQQAFTPAIDYFSGNGSTTAFTLSRPVASVAQVQVTIDNVAQNPSSAYTVSANTITFTSAPLSGTNNIYVYYTSPITQVIAPSQGTVTSESFGTITNFTTTGNTVLGDATTDTLTVGVTGIVKDSSGNVGIGTASPDSSNKLQVTGDIGLTWATDKFIGMKFGAGTSYKMGLVLKDSTRECKVWSQSSDSDDKITFYTGSTPSERMRIDSSGNLLVGSTTNPSTAKVRVYKTGNRANIEAEQGDSGGYNFQSIAFSNGGTYYHCNFQEGSTQRGSIVSNGSNTTYNTGSDYRLKDDVVPMTGALNKISALKPVSWKWKSNGFDGQGFLAHELQEIVPECVTGAKDAVDENENPVYQMVDVSYLVATLTAAIQELKAINDTQAETINALTARIVALENR
jgi:hypothetical protein